MMVSMPSLLKHSGANPNVSFLLHIAKQSYANELYSKLFSKKSELYTLGLKMFGPGSLFMK